MRIEEQARQIRNLRRRKCIAYVDYKHQKRRPLTQTLKEFMEDYAPDGLAMAKQLAQDGITSIDASAGYHYVRDQFALNIQIASIDPTWRDRLLAEYDQILRDFGKHIVSNL